MTPSTILDRVLTVLANKNMKSLDQRVFFVYLNHAIREIMLMYPDSCMVQDGVEQLIIDELTDPIYLDPRYFEAIVSSILYQAGAGEEWQSEFMRLAQLAGRKFKSVKVKMHRFL